MGGMLRDEIKKKLSGIIGSDTVHIEVEALYKGEECIYKDFYIVDLGIPSIDRRILQRIEDAFNVKSIIAFHNGEVSNIGITFFA